MHTRSDPIEMDADDREAGESRERSREAAGSPAHGHQSHARHQAAAADFERLKARLRQLVGTNNTKR